MAARIQPGKRLCNQYLYFRALRLLPVLLIETLKFLEGAGINVITFCVDNLMADLVTQMNKKIKERLVLDMSVYTESKSKKIFF